jgi:hypothetical protein
MMKMMVALLCLLLLKPAVVVAPVVAPKTKSAKGRNRTDDTSIFSAVLYQLSYLGLSR